ncbi:MAG: lytic murein transglycosylase [Oceanidesulfovibrio sp.]
MRTKMTTLWDGMTDSSRVRAIQEDLGELGYAPGKADGKYGPNTEQAIRRYQRDHGLEADGLATRELREHVRETMQQRGMEKPGGGWTSRVYDAGTHPRRIAEGRDFYVLHRPDFMSMERRFGVDAHVVGGIVSVETRSGRYLGVRKAFNTLASMALATDYALMRPFFEDEIMTPEQDAWMRRTAKVRGDWAFEELAALLRYGKSSCQNPVELPGSIYGAIGIAQFMPSNVAKHGVDGDGDDMVNVFSPEDAIHSAGSYLHGYGWTSATAATLQGRRELLYEYNHSQTYVNTVLAVANTLEERDKTVPEPAARTNRVHVADASGLFRAIAPDTRIILAPGVYDLAALAGTVASNHVRWEDRGGRLVPVLHDVAGLTIQSQEGRARFLAPENGPTFVLENVRDIELRDIAFEPRTPQACSLVARVRGEARGQVADASTAPPAGAQYGPGLEAVDSSDVVLEGCSFANLEQGGIRFSGCRDIELRFCHFAGCGRSVLQAERCERVTVRDTFFTANPAHRLMRLEECSEVKITWCGFLDNRLEDSNDPGGTAIVSIEGPSSEHSLHSSVVWGNRAGRFCDRLHALRRHATVIEKNSFKHGLG